MASKCKPAALAVQALTIADTPVRQNAEGMVSLTDLYQVAQSQGFAENKLDPRQWSVRAGSELIEVVAETLHVAKRDIYKTSKARSDRGGGTYAHKNIALAYAKYLSPQLHMAVNDVYLRAKSGDVSLAEEIFDKATLVDQERHAKRVATKVNRNLLTSTLSQHGVHGRGYADCTNAIYLPMIGGTASLVREQRGLKPGANLRDAMNLEELCRTELAEIIARKNIVLKNMVGNTACQSECYRAGMAVANVR